MSQEKVVLLGQSIDELIALFRSESPLSAQIKEYFTSYCDCDIVEWLIAQLTANNTEVVDRVKELIATYDPYPIKREANHPVHGQLLKTFCQGTSRVGYYAVNTSNTKSYEIKTIQLDSESCKAYEVFDNFISPDGKARGRWFYQSDTGTLIQRQQWLDSTDKNYYDVQYGSLDPDSVNYDHNLDISGDRLQLVITAKGAMQAGFMDYSRQWEAMNYDRFDPAGDTNYGYTTTVPKDRFNFETGTTVFFEQLGDAKVAKFDYDVTMAVATNSRSFGVIVAMHRYNKPTIDVSPNQSVDGYWNTAWVTGRFIPRYERQDLTGDGLNTNSYPFQPFDNRCLIGIRGIPLKNRTGVGGTTDEYRFDVTDTLNTFIDSATPGTFLSKTDEFLTPIPKYFTKPRYDSNGLLLGYEFKLKVVSSDTTLKVYFHDFLLLDVEREATTALNIDWHPGVCSPSTNSYITNFYFKTL